MIVEQRTYTLHPGKVAEYLRIYAAEGMSVQIAHLGRMIGYYSTETGPLNTVVHLWAYDNAGDREVRRARMLADPAWQTYIKKVQPMVVSQESWILNPAPFFAEKLAAMIAATARAASGENSAGDAGNP
jgi:hypothetical protein